MPREFRDCFCQKNGDLMSDLHEKYNWWRFQGKTAHAPHPEACSTPAPHYKRKVPLPSGAGNRL
jgi:hypothetical protein